MARRYALSPKALEDIRDIVQFVSGQSGVDAARRFRAGLFDRFERLTSRPTAFRLRPEFGAHLRIARFGAHLIFYEAYDERVRIQRVIHSARNLPTLLTSDPA